MRTGAEVVDQLVLELLVLDPVVEMHVARADVDVQIPFVGPVVHFQHEIPSGVSKLEMSSVSLGWRCRQSPKICFTNGSWRAAHFKGAAVQAGQYRGSPDRNDGGTGQLVEQHAIK